MNSAAREPIYIAELKTFRDMSRDAKLMTEVPAAYFPILASLVIQPGATPTELSAAHGYELDAISRVLKMLREEHGYLHFKSDEHDARRKQFYVTEAGLQEVLKWLAARGIEPTSDELNEIDRIEVKESTSIRRGGRA